MNLEQARDFLNFLQGGELPEDLNRDRVHLDGHDALTVIYVLQDYGVMDEYCPCQNCGELYDWTGEESDSVMILPDTGLEDIAGVSSETIELHEGYGFCSMECLVGFLRENNVG